jgi:hypothetical protein
VRDDVTLVNGSGGGITGFAGNAIYVHGASGESIGGLTVSGSLGDAIRVDDNAAVTIQNLTIENNAGAGVVVSRGAFALLASNTINSNATANGICDVFITDFGTARISNTTIVSNLADPNICAGPGVYRNSFVRMLGANSVTNTTLTGLVIEVAYNSTLRQDAGHSTVSGTIRPRDMAHVEFRDAAITGTVNAVRNSVLRLTNSTVTGDVFVNEINILHAHSLFGPSTVNGTIHCNGGTLFGSADVVATAIDCPAPLHVARDDGTAKIRAEELNAAVAARSMFELANNGPIGFNMTNTDSAQTWCFAAQTTGFRVSLDGTRGPELEVGNAGTLQAGPGGSANLVLDAGGNLTIAGSLTQLSDRNAKTNITPLNPQAVLTKLTNLPISQWAYKSTPTVTHIGPMAQDFHAAFGLGADDKHLAPGDLASVAVVGVQELHKTIEARETTITQQQTEITELKQRLTVLEAALNQVLAAQQAAAVAIADTAQH